MRLCIPNATFKRPDIGTRAVQIGGRAGFRAPTWVKFTARRAYSKTMPLRTISVLICGSCAFAAQNAVSVAEVVTLIQDAVAKHNPDAALAKSLHKLKVTERLDDHAVEELESEGVGPKAAVELERLRDASHALPAPVIAPQFPHDGVPSVPDQRHIVAAAQQIALNYAKSLPDFICTEVIRRYDDTRGGFTLRDTLEVKLTYFDQQENYRMLNVNGRPSIKPFEMVGGAVSKGEFGSMLYSIFLGESKATFRWDHWTTLRKHIAHVFSFRILAANSMYQMQFSTGPAFGKSGVIAGQHGFVYVDRDTNQILRIAAEADSIPRDFPVKQSSTLLDYDFTDVGGRSFLRPIRAEVRMGTEYVHTRNLVEFQGYRKFAGESTITYQD